MKLKADNSSKVLPGSRSVGSPKDAPRASYGTRRVEASGVNDCRPSNSDRRQSAK